MIKHRKNGNGGMKSPSELEGKQIEFPVTYHLKAVMVGTTDDDENKLSLTKVFDKLDITYQYHNKRVSKKGAYVSFTYVVTLNNKEQMDQLYDELKDIKELKFAV